MLMQAMREDDDACWQGEVPAGSKRTWGTTPSLKVTSLH
jgi:hypothetical protein